MTASPCLRPSIAVTAPDGTVYPSIRTAARALGYHPATVRHHWLRYGHLNYLGGWAVPCEYEGRTYPSLEALAKVIGVRRHVLSYHIQRYGNFDRAGQGSPRGNPGNKGPRRSIRIGPLQWPSRKQAAADLGISVTSISRWTGPRATAQQRDKLMAAVMRFQEGWRVAA